MTTFYYLEKVTSLTREPEQVRSHPVGSFLPVLIWRNGTNDLVISVKSLLQTEQTILTSCVPWMADKREAHNRKVKLDRDLYCRPGSSTAFLRFRRSGMTKHRLMDRKHLRYRKTAPTSKVFRLIKGSARSIASGFSLVFVS